MVPGPSGRRVPPLSAGAPAFRRAPSPDSYFNNSIFTTFSQHSGAVRRQ